MRRAAGGGGPARGEHAVEHRVARRPDFQRDAHVGRRDAVEHHAAHAIRMAPRVFHRRARAVRAAPEVDAVVAERGAHRVEIGDPRGGRVLGRVDAPGREFRGAGLRARHRVEFQRGFDVAFVELERGAGERRAAAGAALVDEDDVAVLAHPVELGGERPEVRRRLARAAGEDEQRVALRSQGVGGQDGDENPDAAGRPAWLDPPAPRPHRTGPPSAAGAAGIRRAAACASGLRRRRSRRRWPPAPRRRPRRAMREAGGAARRARGRRHARRDRGPGSFMAADGNRARRRPRGAATKRRGCRTSGGRRRPVDGPVYWIDPAFRTPPP